MDYKVIYDFCKVRNLGPATYNGIDEYTPRVKFLISLIETLGLEYEVDTFQLRGNNLHNIYLKGSSDKWVMAHHDVCNPNIDNANDNSASVINCIGLKTIRPDINVALVDGEEPPVMGAGSFHFGEMVKKGKLNCKWVLNLELSGIGGENFFIGNYNTDLTKKIKEKFGCATMNVPFNDASILISKHGINSALINPCPLKSEWEIVQLGALDSDSDIDFDDDEDLQLEYDEIYDKLIHLDPDSTEYLEVEDRLEEVENRLHNREFSENYQIGDRISDREYKDLLIKIGEENQKLNDNDPSKFICKYITETVEPGMMPRLDQMDTSILYRCHTSEDHVGHIKTNDMKDFVENVLTVICDL